MAGVVGALMLVGTVVTGILVLPVASPPDHQSLAIGIAPPVPGIASEGFGVAMAVHVRDCGSPVAVTLVANATAGYWRLREPEFERTYSDHWSRITVLVPDADVRSMRVGLGVDARDQTLPAYANTPRTDLLRQPQPARIVDGVPSASGEVFKWPRLLTSFVVRFDASWLRPRGIGTCYLRLPPLTGSGTVLAALQALGRSWHGKGTLRCPTFYVTNARTRASGCYDARLRTIHGAAVVSVDKGSVDIGNSLPAPNDAREGAPTWSCSSVATRTGSRNPSGGFGDIVPARNGSGAAFDRRYFTRGRSQGDCSAVVTIAMSNAALTRDIVLLVLGALAGLGAALTIESALAAQFGRHPAEMGGPAQ